MSSSSPLTCCRFLAWCQVEVCCFDKTGTLTSDHLLLEEVVGPGKGDVCDLVMATCQSLVQLEGGDMVGDPLEKASLEVSGRKGACRMIAPTTTHALVHTSSRRRPAGLLPTTQPSVPTSPAPRPSSTVTISTRTSSA